jgi:propionyl-CoA carboxylase alpha chain
MIAKLITHGENREQAIERMADALDAYYIRGVSHNLSFLNALIAHPRFKEGRLTTNFIADEFPDGFHVSDVPQADPLVLVAIAGVVHLMELARAAHISGQTRRFERQPREDWVVIANRTHYPVKIEAHDQGFAVHHQDLVYRITTDWLLGNPVLEAEVNGVPTTVQVEHRGAGYRLGHRGAQLDATVLSPRAASLSAHMIEREAPDLSKLLLSPMPGLLVRLSVTEGAEVKVGEELAAIEAMKMENSLRAPDNVVIAKILVAQGDSLELDQTIMEFE